MVLFATYTNTYTKHIKCMQESFETLTLPFSLSFCSKNDDANPTQISSRMARHVQQVP